MKKYNGKNLNIKRLLELGDLNIRGIAAQNESITASEYFSKVEQFIENSSQLMNVFLSVSEIVENLKALKDLEAKLGVTGRSVDFAANAEKLNELEGIKSVLTEIGYDKLNFDIDSICKSIKGNSLQLAEKLADEVFIKFSTFLDRTKSAYSAKRFAKAQVKSEDKPTNDPNDKILLIEALDYLDYEEANRKLRILAVDDVSVVLNSITSVLSPYYEVFALKSSSQVEKFMTHTTPELFLLDIEMSGMNGFELVPLIRRFEKHRDTPIIFLTGNASYNNLKDALALGACDFITKPVNQTILLEKIEKNIVRKKAY